MYVRTVASAMYVLKHTHHYARVTFQNPSEDVASSQSSQSAGLSFQDRASTHTNTLPEIAVFSL